MNTIYCANDPCEAEATHYYVTEEGVRFPLCSTCANAFELGQANAEANLVFHEDNEENEDEE